jgi:hypothetical protein
MYFGRSASQGADEVLTPTDSLGRAMVYLVTGGVAGRAAVVATVSELGVSDSASYTVLPGDPQFFAIAPRDTTLLPGATYPVQAVVTDFYGNPLPAEPITWEPGPLVTHVDGTGSVTVAAAPGGGSVRVQSGSLRDSATVTIMPPGKLAGTYQPPRGANRLLVVADANGSRRRTLLTVPNGDPDLHPSLAPDGSRVVFMMSDASGRYALYIADTTGAMNRLTPPTISDAFNP